MASIKVIAQVEKNNNCICTFHAVMGNDVRRIGAVQYPIGTAWADGTACNEEIVKALQKCFSKTIRNINKQ